MAESEGISRTGQFASLALAEPASSYRASSDSSSAPAQAKPTPFPTTEAQTPKAASGATDVQTVQPSTQEIQAAIDRANVNLSSSDRVLDYRVDAATGIHIAVIRNSQTGAVLQQIPGADILALARMLADWAPGKHMLLDLIA